jgi:hypothetical protein
MLQLHVAHLAYDCFPAHCSKVDESGDKMVV